MRGKREGRGKESIQDRPRESAVQTLAVFRDELAARYRQRMTTARILRYRMSSRMQACDLGPGA